MKGMYQKVAPYVLAGAVMSGTGCVSLSHDRSYDGEYSKAEVGEVRENKERDSLTLEKVFDSGLPFVIFDGLLYYFLL
jgi:hypothetical protein